MKVLVIQALWLSVFTLTFSTAIAACAHSEATSSYRCDKHWRGPAIVLRGVVVPLPKGYFLVDKTSHPHVFVNFNAIMNGKPPGEMHIGFAPEYADRAVVEKEFQRQKHTWNGIRREKFVHLKSGGVLDFFWFGDGVMMEFSGAALPYAELIASCYLELLPFTVDTHAEPETAFQSFSNGSTGTTWRSFSGHRQLASIQTFTNQIVHVFSHAWLRQ